MKRTAFIFTFLFFTLLSYAQVSKADVTTFMANNADSAGYLKIWNAYSYDASSSGTDVTYYKEYNLKYCSFSYSETAMTINAEKAVMLFPYASIMHMNLYKLKSKSYLVISLAD